MAGQLLIDEPLDGVRRLTISNPAKRNALDHAILDGIAAAVREAGGMDSGTARRAIGWARDQTWERRWPAWSGAVFGTPAGRAA